MNFSSNILILNPLNPNATTGTIFILKKKKKDPQINKTEQEQSSGRATKLLV